MKKYVKLNAPVYGKSDHLQCESIYRKGLGYCIEIDPVELTDGMISMVFGKEYFALENAGLFLIKVGTRRSAKGQEEADSTLETRLSDLVNEYLMRINRPDLHAEEE